MNVFLEVGLFLSVRVCVSFITAAQNNHTRESKFRILHAYHVQMLLETLYEGKTKHLCTRAFKKILKYFLLWSKFLVGAFKYL